MEEDKKDIRVPEVKFTFIDNGKSEEEIKKEVEELIKKRDILLAALRNSPTSNDNAVEHKE